MIIFYPPTTEGAINPVVVADFLDSSDRWTTVEISALVNANAPKATTFIPSAGVTVADSGVKIANQSVYSCPYRFEYSFNGIPLGEGIKAKFRATISVPPASLISQLSPTYFMSAQSLDDMANATSKIANPQTKPVIAVLVMRDSEGKTISRKFILYTAQISPDLMGSTVSLTIFGASIEDTLINSEIGVVLDKKSPLKDQLNSMLSNAGYTAVFNTFDVYDPPVAEKLLPPMKINKILDVVCLQNKLIYSITDKVVTFYSQTQKPDALPFPTTFSFLGYSGLLAWAVGIENYVNIKFKTTYFDAQLFQPIRIYNDIRNAMFSGLAKNNTPSLYDLYDAYIIRYSFIRSSSEVIAEVTASNNWLFSQIRVDGMLEASVYGAAI